MSIEVPRGTILGFLGRNGAGKSTTIRMLLGLLEPTRGSSMILEYDSMKLPAEERARIGYLPEGHHVYGWMSVAECRKFQKSFYPHWNDDIFNSVIAYFGIAPKTKSSHLSRGERAGLCLALVLAPEPELLILDDPALGLDPVARRSLLEAMVYVTKSGERTILFSSHMVSDVERVADRILILDRGVLRADCSVEIFRSLVKQFVLKFKAEAPRLPQIPGLLRVFRAGKELSVTLVDQRNEAETMFQRLQPDRIERMPLQLEEAFIGYVGERGERSFLRAEGEGGI
ncbi:MAG: ABC transporter ATP-binding protein [Acidobacteriota bacterium]